MTTEVVHQPRVAYDAARAFVAVAADPAVPAAAIAARMTELLGTGYGEALLASRRRLTASTRPEAPLGEVGVWRARLEDALRARPELAREVRALGAEARDLRTRFGG